MVVYELLHTYYMFQNMPYYSYKRLGYYSDMENLNAAISFYCNLPGFCDAPNGFVVKQKELIAVKMDPYVYSACVYAHTEDFENYEYEVDLGLFCDEESADSAIRQFRANNEVFLNSPSLVCEQLVEKYRINEHCGWVDGFVVEEIC